MRSWSLWRADWSSEPKQRISTGLDTANCGFWSSVTFISTNRMMKNRRVSAYQEEHTETKLRKICGIYAGNSRKKARQGKSWTGFYKVSYIIILWCEQSCGKRRAVVANGGREVRNCWNGVTTAGSVLERVGLWNWIIQNVERDSQVGCGRSTMYSG